MSSEDGFYYDAEKKQAVFLGNRVEGETENGTFSVEADHIVFYENKARIIGYTNDYVPSISPVDDKLVTNEVGYGMMMNLIVNYPVPRAQGV